MSLQLVSETQLQKPDIQNSFHSDSYNRDELPIHLIHRQGDQPHKDVSMTAGCKPATQNCITDTDEKELF